MHVGLDVDQPFGKCFKRREICTCHCSEIICAKNFHTSFSQGKLSTILERVQLYIDIFSY